MVMCCVFFVIYILKCYKLTGMLNLCFGRYSINVAVDDNNIIIMALDSMFVWTSCLLFCVTFMNEFRIDIYQVFKKAND